MTVDKYVCQSCGAVNEDDPTIITKKGDIGSFSYKHKDYCTVVRAPLEVFEQTFFECEACDHRERIDWNRRDTGITVKLMTTDNVDTANRGFWEKTQKMRQAARDWYDK